MNYTTLLLSLGVVLSAFFLGRVSARLDDNNNMKATSLQGDDLR